MAYQVLAAEHEKGGLLYPRPKIKCDGCGKDLIVCWGKKMPPYIRHLSTVNCGYRYTTESIEHYTAKKLLVSYLNNGKSIKFKKQCCGRESYRISKYKLRISGEALKIVKWKSEHTINGDGKYNRLDVAATCKSKHALFCIEVFHTHRTSEGTLRDNIPWVEVNATEVISKIDSKVSSIKLSDVRIFPECTCIEQKILKDRLKRQRDIILLQETKVENSVITIKQLEARMVESDTILSRLIQEHEVKKIDIASKISAIVLEQQDYKMSIIRLQEDFYIKRQEWLAVKSSR